MAKFAVIGGYTADAWAKMIDNPGDRTAAVSKALEALGGKLESFYWSFGDDDFLGIIDVPDDAAAGAFSVAVGSSGTLRNLRTIKLMSIQEGRKILEHLNATDGFVEAKPEQYELVRRAFEATRAPVHGRFEQPHNVVFFFVLVLLAGLLALPIWKLQPFS